MRPDKSHPAAGDDGHQLATRPKRRADNRIIGTVHQPTQPKDTAQITRSRTETSISPSVRDHLALGPEATERGQAECW